MATNATVMAGLIADKIIEVNDSAVKADLVIYWEPICQAILDHFKNDAEILPGTFKDSLSAPITGKGVIS